MTARALSLVVFLRAASLISGELSAMLEGDLRAAQDVDPLSFEVRQAQVEVLLQVRRLEEAVLVARAAKDLFPGNFQAWSTYAVAETMLATHGGADFDRAIGVAREAWRRDPASTRAIQQIMFLLSAQGENLAEFKALGMHRAQISGYSALNMTCRLCDRHWLAHRQKSAPSSNPK